jgi:hypothetical protein
MDGQMSRQKSVSQAGSAALHATFVTAGRYEPDRRRD